MPSVQGTCRKHSTSFFPWTGRTSMPEAEIWRAGTAIERSLKGAQHRRQRAAASSGTLPVPVAGAAPCCYSSALSAMDLKDTVNLPRTGFPMRAQLAEREPAQVKAWQEGKVYEQILRHNAGREKFVFHDGPPYANGSIHLGHFLNKVLKDIVVKHASMSGKLSDFVPGWDCHGLPIELQVDKQLGPRKREMSASDFRRACRKFAEEQVEVQRGGFLRLGILAR